MPGNVYWKNSKSIYMGCNNNVARISNFPSKEEIVGLTDFDLEKNLKWPAGTAKRFIQDDQEVLHSKKPKTFEDRFIEANGRTVTMLTTKSPIFNDEGNVVGILATSLDITSLKKKEDEWLIIKE